MSQVIKLAIDEIAKDMGELIAKRAKDLLDKMTDDERERIVSHTQCIRSAKILCIAVLEAQSDSLLVREYICDAVLPEIKVAKRILRSQR